MSQSADPASDIRDPVCGKAVDPLRARAVGIFGGVTRYFCSPECKALYRDPRSGAPDAPPAGGERRLSEPRAEGGDDGTGEWFASRAVAPRAAPVEDFSDLERSAAPQRQLPPSPSLMLDVRAVRGPRTWLWVVLLALGASGLVALVLR